MWEYRGQKRPAFAVQPAPGQESVWDYPRPPRLEADSRRIEVRSKGITIADSRNAFRVLETASPPSFYIPPHDVRTQLLASHPSSSWCEWKGNAKYWALNVEGQPREMVGWSYPRPDPGFEKIARYFSFYPDRVECYVDGERVGAQPGGFYGGWVTTEIVGPVKGDTGTQHW